MRIRTAMVVLLMTCGLVHAKPQEIVVKETNIAYYVSMTTDGLNYAVTCFRTATPKDKLVYARNISLHLFQYYFQTSHGNTVSFPGLDVFMSSLYRDVFKNDDLCVKEEVFTDPLGWVKQATPRITISNAPEDGWTQKAYLEMLVLYMRFLETGRRNAGGERVQTTSRRTGPAVAAPARTE